MKSKILLGSVTLLSAFILAACGNGDKKTSEFSEEPSTEVTITADASDETKAVSYTDTQRIGSDDIGYVNIPKDWIFIKSQYAEEILEYESKDKNTRVLLNSFAKNDVHPQNQDVFGVKFIATYFSNTLRSEETVVDIDGEWSKVAGMNAYVLKSHKRNGEYLFDWFFQKGEKVYVFGLEGTEENITTFRPMLEQSWGLDPKTPGK
ncbi:MAG: hypothetical protein E6318_05120 [Streptococcus mitis]|nr:hypothetical protein [Streptococcus mitis]